MTNTPVQQASTTPDLYEALVARDLLYEALVALLGGEYRRPINIDRPVIRSSR